MDYCSLLQPEPLCLCMFRPSSGAVCFLLGSFFLFFSVGVFESFSLHHPSQAPPVAGFTSLDPAQET